MNNNNQAEFPIFPIFPNKDSIRSYKRVIPISIYDFYIIDDIEDPEKYLELIQTLKSAEPQDTIFIYLNTNGGSLNTTIQILSAMNSSQAKVVTCLEGQVCSAGTFIFLKGDTKIINPHGTFMIHSYSQTSSGKGNEIVSHIKYMSEYFNKLAIDIYKGFLTEDEVMRVVDGNDMWMDSHEVAKRLESSGHDYIYTGEDLDLAVNVETELVANKVNPITKTGKKVISKKATKQKK